MMDDTWFVGVELGVAREMIVRWHLKTGIERCCWDAVKRAEENEMANGEDVRTGWVESGVVVRSVHEAKIGGAGNGVMGNV